MASDVAARILGWAGTARSLLIKLSLMALNCFPTSHGSSLGGFVCHAVVPVGDGAWHDLSDSGLGNLLHWHCGTPQIPFKAGHMTDWCNPPTAQLDHALKEKADLLA